MNTCSTDLRCHPSTDVEISAEGPPKIPIPRSSVARVGPLSRSRYWVWGGQVKSGDVMSFLRDQSPDGFEVTNQFREACC